MFCVFLISCAQCCRSGVTTTTNPESGENLFMVNTTADSTIALGGLKRIIASKKTGQSRVWQVSRRQRRTSWEEKLFLMNITTNLISVFSSSERVITNKKQVIIIYYLHLRSQLLSSSYQWLPWCSSSTTQSSSTIFIFFC